MCFFVFPFSNKSMHKNMWNISLSFCGDFYLFTWGGPLIPIFILHLFFASQQFYSSTSTLSCRSTRRGPPCQRNIHMPTQSNLISPPCIGGPPALCYAIIFYRSSNGVQLASTLSSHASASTSRWKGLLQLALAIQSRDVTCRALVRWWPRRPVGSIQLMRQSFQDLPRGVAFSNLIVEEQGPFVPRVPQVLLNCWQVSGRHVLQNPC